MTKNQISADCRFIESNKVFQFNEIIADIKLIYATYYIFSVAVKSESLKIWPPVNKRANPGARIHPFELWLQTNIQNDFGRIVERIMKEGHCGVILKKK